MQGPLQASASQVATAFLSQSIGAIVAPFLVGLIADRYFAAQLSSRCCTWPARC